MTVTYPSAYVVTKTGGLVLPPMTASPLSTALLNANACYALHAPALLSVVYTVDPGITRASSFRLPIRPSADSLDYTFRHMIRAGTGTTGITVTIEERNGGGAWSTIYGPTVTAAGASAVVDVNVAATISAATDEIRVSYSRGPDPYTPDSLTVYPRPGSPSTRQASGFWPYDDGLLTAAGAPINTELLNRPLRSVRAVLNDRAQVVLSFAQEDDGTPANVRHDLTAGSAPADEWQTIGVVACAMPFAPRRTTITARAIASVDGGATAGRVRVRSSSAGSVTLDGTGAVVSGTVEVWVSHPGTAQAYATLVVEARAASSRSTYVHAVTADWAPQHPSTLLLNSVAPPASIQTLIACVRGVEQLVLAPWCQPGLIFEGNTTGLDTRRWVAQIPPATSRMSAYISRATAATGSAQTDTTIATTTTSGVPASPASSIVTVDCPSHGAEGFLDVDGSGLDPLAVWSSDGYDPSPLPGSTVDRELHVVEGLAPSSEIVEVAHSIAAALHYVRRRPVADYEEL